MIPEYINQNILFSIIKTYGYFFVFFYVSFWFYISVLYITKEEVPARDQIERKEKKKIINKCKSTPYSYSISFSGASPLLLIRATRDILI